MIIKVQHLSLTVYLSLSLSLSSSFLSPLSLPLSSVPFHLHIFCLY